MILISGPGLTSQQTAHKHIYQKDHLKMTINFKQSGNYSPVQTKGQNVNLTLKSRNKKTGPIPVSTSGKHTCPDACPLKASGACYAMAGPLGLFWAKVSNNNAGTKYKYFWTRLKHYQTASCGVTIKAAI